MVNMVSNLFHLEVFKVLYNYLVVHTKHSNSGAITATAEAGSEKCQRRLACHEIGRQLSDTLGQWWVKEYE